MVKAPGVFGSVRFSPSSGCRGGGSGGSPPPPPAGTDQPADSATLAPPRSNAPGPPPGAPPVPPPSGRVAPPPAGSSGPVLADGVASRRLDPLGESGIRPPHPRQAAVWKACRPPPSPEPDRPPPVGGPPSGSPAPAVPADNAPPTVAAPAGSGFRPAAVVPPFDRLRHRRQHPNASPAGCPGARRPRGGRSGPGQEPLAASGGPWKGRLRCHSRRRSRRARDGGADSGSGCAGL
jgi:hypothetical protein